MRTYYGTIRTVETLDFRQIEKIEQRCRSERSEYIFDLLKLTFGIPSNIVQRISAIPLEKLAEYITTTCTKGVSIIVDQYP